MKGLASRPESTDSVSNPSRRDFLGGVAAVFGLRSRFGTMAASVLSGCGKDNQSKTTKPAAKRPEVKKRVVKDQKTDGTGEVPAIEHDEPEHGPIVAGKSLRAQEIEREFANIEHLEFADGFEIVFDQDMTSMSPESMQVLKEAIAKRLDIDASKLRIKVKADSSKFKAIGFGSITENGTTRTYKIPEREGVRKFYSGKFFYKGEQVASANWDSDFMDFGNGVETLNISLGKDKGEIALFKAVPARETDGKKSFKLDSQSRLFEAGSNHGFWERGVLKDGGSKESLSPHTSKNPSQGVFTDILIDPDGKVMSIWETDRVSGSVRRVFENF